MDMATQIKEKIIRLEESLAAQHPQFKDLLREIHTTLKANPDCVTLLEPEEVGAIVNGLKRQTNTEIATAALKTKTKSLKSLSIADL